MDSMPLYPCGTAPIILAHRGGALEHPENSRAAFEAMCDGGFCYIETDAQVTSDGVAVIFHDPVLERTSDGAGMISEQTWEQLQEVCAGDGRPLMRVDEVLRDFPEMIFNIDIKTEGALGPVLAAIEAAKAHERVCLASFDSARLKRARLAMPTVPTSIGNAEAVRLFTRAQLPRPVRSLLPAFGAKYGGSVQAAQLPLTFKGIFVITPRLIRAAHESGLAVHAWTVNDVETAARLIDWGVDGIVTDRPAFMRQELGI
ncbi:MAG: glycerophosphodiester phosphodiesterase [Actinomycetaceae bacterium]|nr:glycerophosphodiester phosphodiesterase [Actinomycetaceae bacterium]